MSSEPRNVGTDSAPVWSLQVYSTDGRTRVTFGLGDNEKKARACALRVLELREHLIGGGHPGAFADWIDRLSPKRRRGLVKLGFIEPAQAADTAAPAAVAPVLKLEAWIDKFLEQKAHEHKPRTRETYKQTKARLVKQFGATIPLAEITPAGAKEWEAAMRTEGLGVATVRFHCRNAKAIAGEAVRQELIVRDPFRHLASAAVAGAKVYVSVADALKVIDKLPDWRYRALFALCRFGGLRSTSETHLLTWDRVLWEGSRLLVEAPKTTRRNDAEPSTRFVPITPTLAPFLREAEKAGVGPLVLPALTADPKILHRRVEAAAIAAGVKPWPKVLQALRQSCETDWLAQHPAHVCAAWIGHSVAVQSKHYATVHEADFARASDPKAAEKLRYSNAG